MKPTVSLPRVICPAVAEAEPSPRLDSLTELLASLFAAEIELIHADIPDGAPPESAAQQIAAKVSPDGWLVSETRNASRWSGKTSITEHLIDAHEGVSVVIGPDATVPDATASDRTVLLALDGSAAAQTALPVAEALAVAIGRDLLVCRVLPAPLHEEANSAHEDIASGLRETCGSVTPAMTIVLPRSNDPIEAIVAVAKDQSCSFVVLASRGDRASARATMSRTTAGLLADAPCPVVVVQSKGADHV